MTVFALADTTKTLNTKEPTDLNMSHFVSPDMELFDAWGDKVSHDVLDGKFVGIYFSAPWCGPCKPFTTHLRSFRTAFGDKFEVVFISLDKKHSNTAKSNLLEKYAYMRSIKMPGYTINIKYEMAMRLYLDTNKKGIPNVIVFSPTRKYVTNRGRANIQLRPFRSWSSWRKSENE